MIRPMNSLTAYALAREMNKVLPGGRISKVELFNGGATLHLEGAPFAFAHLIYFGRTRELFPGKARIASEENSHEVIRSLRGTRIAGVRPLGMERILLFKLEGAWDAELLLRIDLVPSGKAAVLFGGRGERTIEAIGAERAKSPSSPEVTPPTKRLSILSLPADPPAGLLESAEGSGPADLSDRTKALAREKRALRWLLDSVGGVDPVMTREVSRSCGGDPVRTWAAIRDIGMATTEERWSWRIYEFPRIGRGVLYPVELPVDAPSSVFPGFIEAFHRASETFIVPSFVSDLKRTVSMRAARELKRLEKLSANIADDISQAERSKEMRHFGNLLVANRHAMKPGMREITVRDFSGDRNITIALNPAKPPDENIRAYFKRAKKGEKGILILRIRRREVERILSEKKKVMADIERIPDPDSLLTLIPAKRYRGERGPSRATTRFRRFELNGRHIALVGRSNQENDLLTHRFASPGDLWFHAQGVPGSHVILKGATRSTPKKILESVAAIAAYYSKARHSTTVPVVYAEKRYVRKPRKSKPGTAVCQRSKTLFVKPAIPGPESTD
jgi:predicted ribosome quality control (RQC) complex YloA/Tae2 family protein